MGNKIWVLGGANIDILGTSVNELIEFDSNIGEIELGFGGVGRNIAQAAVQLGAKVNFISCFSNDHYGRLIKEDCENLGMDISYSMFTDKYPTSMYLAILGPDHDMKIAMNDMRILDEMNRDVISNFLVDVSTDDIIVIDSNFRSELLAFITENARCRIASDPVSINKIPRLEPIIHNISIFMPNKIEAEALTGIEITDEESAKKNINWFFDKGVSEIVITMAERGVLLGAKYENEDQENSKKMYWYRHRTVNMDNANGGGDMFSGAYLRERINGSDPVKSTKYAISAAITRIESSSDKRREITDEIVRRNIDSAKISVQEI